MRHRLARRDRTALGLDVEGEPLRAERHRGPEPHVLHTGERGDLALDPLVEGHRLFVGLGVVGGHLEREAVAGGEAGVHDAEPLHGAGQQAGAGEQHDRDGDLGHHQGLLQPLAPDAAGGPLAAGREAGAEGVLPDQPRRVGEEHGDDEGEPERERQDHTVHPDLPGPRAHALGEGDQHPHAAERDQEA